MSRIFRKGEYRWVKDHHHIGEEGSRCLSFSVNKRRTVVEAQNSVCSVAMWLSQASRKGFCGPHKEQISPRGEEILARLVLGAPSEIEFLCHRPFLPSSLFRVGLVVKETRLWLRRYSFSSWLHHKLFVLPLEGYLTCVGLKFPACMLGILRVLCLPWGVGKVHCEAWRSAGTVILWWAAWRNVWEGKVLAEWACTVAVRLLCGVEWDLRGILRMCQVFTAKQSENMKLYCGWRKGMQTMWKCSYCTVLYSTNDK